MVRVDRRRTGRSETIVRGALTVFFVLLLLVSLLPLAGRVVNVGVIVPAAVSLLGLAGCVWTAALRRILLYIWKRKGLRVILLVVVGLAAALLVLFIVVSIVMLRGAARPAPDNATVIVLGAAVYGDRPCLMLAQRLDATAKYLEANPEASCVVSGGQGADEEYTEASVMKAYLLEKGIPEDRVYLEDASTNTQENIRFSKKVIEDNGLNATVVMATQEFHQYRAQAFAKKEGFTEVGPCTCRTPAYLLLCYWVREFAAICRMTLLGY